MPSDGATPDRPVPRSDRGADLRVESGEAWLYFAFDAGAAIDLDAAERRLRATTAVEREHLSGTRRAPAALQFKPKPLRAARRIESVTIGQWSSAPEIEYTLYDFGAISVAFRVPLRPGPVAELVALTRAVHDTPAPIEVARAGIEALLAELGDAVQRPRLAEPVEDHLVLHLDAWSGGAPEASPSFAAVLRASDQPLSDDETTDALACRIGYGRNDLALVDWAVTLLFEPDAASAADALAVLEFANVELLEMRFLDDRLDALLHRSYHDLSTGALEGGVLRPFARRGRDDRRRLAAIQMDGALLFENINNALKLVGDPFLARLYRLAARRFHLAEWDTAVLRKIDTVQRLYEKLADERANRRMEILEWIIIVLIAISIVLPFVPGATK